MGNDAVCTSIQSGWHAFIKWSDLSDTQDGSPRFPSLDFQVQEHTYFKFRRRGLVSAEVLVHYEISCTNSSRWSIACRRAGAKMRGLLDTFCERLRTR